MSIQTSSVVAFVVTVVVGTAALGVVRVAVIPGSETDPETPTAEDGTDEADADGAPARERDSGTEAERGRSLAEMMAEHDRLLQALRDAEAAGDGAALMKAVTESEGQFRAPTTIIEHSAYRAIALCRSGQTDEGQKEASLWIQSHEKHSLRAKVEAACASDKQDATDGG